MKKLFLVLGVSLLCFSFTACSSNKKKDDSNKKVEASAEPETSASSFDFKYYGKDNPEVKYDIKDCVKLGKYKGISVKTSAIKDISRKEINDYIVSALADSSVENRLDRKEIKKDDYLRVTRDGDEETSLFHVSESGDENIKILTQHKVGDTVTIKNKDDENTEYTFKIEYVVELHTIKDISEVTEDILKEKTPFTKLKDLRAYLKKVLVARSENQVGLDCMKVVINNSKITVPDGLVDYYTNGVLASMEKYCADNGISNLDTYILSQYNKSVDDYIASLNESNEYFVKQLLICKAISEKEKIKGNDKLYDKYVEYTAYLSGFENKESFLSSVNEDEVKEQYNTVYIPLSFVVENAKVTYTSSK